MAFFNAIEIPRNSLFAGIVPLHPLSLPPFGRSIHPTTHTIEKTSLSYCWKKMYKFIQAGVSVLMWFFSATVRSSQGAPFVANISKQKTLKTSKKT